MGTVIGMYAGATGGAQNAIASIDVPANGDLVGVDWDVNSDMDTDLDITTFELSFGSTSSITTNDTRSRISTCATGAVSILTAVGASVGKGTKYVALPDIPVGMGERIYLHALSGATTPASAWANLHFSFDLDKAQVRRR